MLAHFLIRKLTDFDSLIETDYMSTFKTICLNLFKRNDPDFNAICLQTLDKLHSISCLPFNTLVSHYVENNELAVDLKYSGLNVITQSSTSAWNLFNVKQVFFLAKKVFANELTIAGPHLTDEEYTDDDRNIYRDFTVKFVPYLARKTSLFDQEETSPDKQVSLTCLIIAFKYHMDLMNAMSAIVDEANLTDEIVLGFLKYFSKTYLMSLKMEEMLSFKILLNKIFYLNDEGTLANFVNLAKVACAGINSIHVNYVSVDVESSDVNNNKIYMDKSSSWTLETDLSSLELAMCQNESIRGYFVHFIQHLFCYYAKLNEKAHNALLDASTLTKILNNENFMSRKSFLDLSFPDCHQVLADNDEYSKRDSCIIYHIWSNEIMSEYLFEVNKPNNLQKMQTILKSFDIEHKKTLIYSLISMLAVLKSCQSSCTFFNIKEDLVNVCYTLLENI